MTLIVNVDEDTAPALNNGHDLLEDILVLHLEKGKDFFITVSGNYLPSCFGSSLETLVHLHTYIREVPVAQLVDLVCTVSSTNWQENNCVLQCVIVTCRPKKCWIVGEIHVAAILIPSIRYVLYYPVHQVHHTCSTHLDRLWFLFCYCIIRVHHGSSVPSPLRLDPSKRPPWNKYHLLSTSQRSSSPWSTLSREKELRR